MPSSWFMLSTLSAVKFNTFFYIINAKFNGKKSSSIIKKPSSTAKRQVQLLKSQVQWLKTQVQLL